MIRFFGILLALLVDQKMLSQTGKTMQREQVLNILSAHKQELATKYGVRRLGIFGSVARNEAKETSDIDIIVEMPPDLFQMVHMKEDLEHLLAASVDLIRYQKHLNTLLKRRIDNEAVYV